MAAPVSARRAASLLPRVQRVNTAARSHAQMCLSRSLSSATGQRGMIPQSRATSTHDSRPGVNPWQRTQGVDCPSLTRSISSSTRSLAEQNDNQTPNPSSSSGGSTELTRPCTSCSAAVPLPISPCPSCSALLPLSPHLSLHSLLDLSSPIPSSSSTSTNTASGELALDIPAELASLPARGFDLQPRSLRQTMLLRQRDLHPDKYGGGDAGELAKELSGRVNAAYAVLGDPLKRAEYILSVHGYPTEETDSLTDPDLLMEVLEAREELEEATSAEQVEGLRQTNHEPFAFYLLSKFQAERNFDETEKVQSTIEDLKSALSTSPPDFDLAKTLTIQLRYWTGLEAAAKEWAPGKGAGPSAGSGFTHS